MHWNRWLTGTAVLAGALVLVQVLAACVSWPWTPGYGPANRLDDTPAQFAAGHLGIIHANAGVRDLIVAWRYLAGRPLSSSEQRQFTASPDEVTWMPAPPQAPPETALDAWTAASGQAFSEYATQPFNGQTWAPGIYRESTLGNDWDMFLNCPADAFANAVATLHSRAKRYADPALLRDWMSAQVTVFSNCSGPVPRYINRNAQPAAPRIPAPLPVIAPALARADRDYQIAAARLYALQYQQAAAAFEAIALDRSSPWHASADYLAARAMVREATMQPDAPANRQACCGATRGDSQVRLLWLGKAEAKVEAVLADRADSAWWQPARQLRGYIELRLHPHERALELAHQLSGPNDPTFEQDSIDLAYLDAGARPAAAQPAEQNPLLQWLTLLPAARYDTALAKWQQTHALPWLVMALSATRDPSAPGVPDLLQAAAAVPSRSPAFETAQYQRLRVEHLAGHASDAEIQATLAKLPLSGMATATHNQFLALKLATAPSLEVALAAAPRVGSDGAWTGFDQDALTLFNQALPLNLLAQAAQTTALPSQLQGEVLVAAWTRAILLRDDAMARSLAPALARLEPALAPDLTAYTATTQYQYQQRQFDAVWLLLHFPGMSPYVQDRYDESGHRRGLAQLDDEGNNWWYGGVPGAIETGYSYGAGVYAGTYQPPSFLTAAMVYRWLAQSGQLHATAAPDLLCSWVLDWVRAQPNDPRDAEALALAVAATAQARGDAQTAGFSQMCYNLLKTKYPGSEWARKTLQPYSGYCGRYEVCQK